MTTERFAIDLTMPIREGITAYPSHGRSVLRLSPVMKHSDFAGKGRANTFDGADVSFEVTQWLLGDQVGTHMDAPFHADPTSEFSIDRVSLESAFGEAVWIDCRAAAEEGGISVRRLELGLAAAGEALRENDIVLLRTGASDAAIEHPEAYASTVVGLDRDAALWLRAAGVKTVGIDCISIEARAGVATADAHTVLLRPQALGLRPSAVIGVIENLVNIGEIPEHRFLFSGLPLPLVGAAGSPLRAAAFPLAAVGVSEG